MPKFKSHFSLSPQEYETARGGHLGLRRYEAVRGALTAANASAGVEAVLEIGSGTGKLLADLAAEFPAVTFLGIDTDPEMVTYAEETHRSSNLSYALSNVAGLDPASSFDFVYNIDVIHHIHDPLDSFTAIRRSLRPRGSWLSIEPNIFHPYVWLSQERMRRAGLDEDHFRPWLIEPLWREAGFSVVQRRYAFAVPSAIRRLPRTLMRAECLVERFRLVGGSVIYHLI